MSVFHRAVSFSGITWRPCSSRASVWSPAKEPWNQATNAPSLSHGLLQVDTRWRYHCYWIGKTTWEECIRKCLHKSTLRCVYCWQHTEVMWSPIFLLADVFFKKAIRFLNFTLLFRYSFMRSLSWLTECVFVCFSPTKWCRHVCLLPWRGMRRMFTESPWWLWSPPLLTDLRRTWMRASGKTAHTHTHCHTHCHTTQRCVIYCIFLWPKSTNGLIIYDMNLIIKGEINQVYDLIWFCERVIVHLCTLCWSYTQQDQNGLNILQHFFTVLWNFKEPAGIFCMSDTSCSSYSTSKLNIYDKTLCITRFYICFVAVFTTCKNNS